MIDVATPERLPARPECGSIEINKMIDAINRGDTVNPCPGNPERDRWWKDLNRDKKNAVAYALQHGHSPDIMFAKVDPDEYETAILERMIP